MRKIAFIPARSGSKGIPDKNLLELNNRSLLERAVVSSIQAEAFDQVFVSTDSSRYAELAMAAGASVPFLRASELAGDSIQTIDVIMDFLARLDISKEPTFFFLLQTTSPFRSPKHIQESVSLLEMHNYSQSLMTIKSVEGMHPFRMQAQNSFGLYENYEDLKWQNFEPRQHLPKIYIRNGAIYANSVQDIITNKRIIREVNLGIEMSAIDSINIDNVEDYWLAQCVIHRGERT